MSIVHLTNPEIGEIRSDLDVNNVLVEGVLTCNIAPVLPDVIFDTTDLILSTNKLMVSNGTHEIKQSLLDASSDNLVFPTNKYVQVDEVKSLVGDAVTINADTNLNLNGAQILTNCDIKIETTKKLYVDKILDQNNGGNVGFEANINALTHYISCDNLNTNVITSNATHDLTINSVANKNINIDALGTGKILFNTVSNSGMIITTNETYPVYVTKDINNYNSLVLATNSVSPYVPFIACTREGVAIKPLRLGFENMPVVIADNTTADASFIHSLEVNGSINLRSSGVGSFYIGGSVCINSNKDITARNLTLTGNTFPKEIGGFINQSVAFPGGLGGIRIAVPSSVTILKEIRVVCTLSGSDSTANLEVRDASGTLMATMSTSSNSTQLLSATGSFSFVGSNWLELTTSFTGGTVGIFTIASHTMAF